MPVASSIPRAPEPEPSARKRKRSTHTGIPSAGGDLNQKKACPAKKPVEDEDNSDGGTTTIVHESLKENSVKDKTGAKLKYAPIDETSEQRDARTIFVGNLPIEVAQKKSSLKRLHRHILTLVPSAKVESTRFRSVPFQTPTTKLPTSDDEASSPKKKAGAATASETKLPRSLERTSSWRDRREDDGKNDEKKFLTPKEKKKIAFINHDFHSSADMVNAYLVFAHPPPPDSRPSNVPPLPPVMDPYQAARLAATKCDGTLFMERMIRVDVVHKAEHRDGKIVDGDPKLSIFVGNLDFESKEEDLRVFFEAAVSSERGPYNGGDGKSSWVTRVRIVRDKDTQLGKGFAYVQFADRECVDEVLAFDDTKRKFAKRKLRLQRCKTHTGPSSTPKVPPSTNSSKDPGSSSQVKSVKRTPVPIVPKGDPSLGEKLAHLSKDARKQIKSSDADRIARRLAKKKARMALAVDGVKPKLKDRERVRKPSIAKKGPDPHKKRSKGKVMSEKGLAKRNTKK